jgi:anti-sigma B factor antagonist
MAAPTEQHIKIDSGKIGGGDVYELKIEGYLDFSSSEQVERAIEEIFGQGCYRVVVNLSKTKYISSAGFGCFISSIDTAMKNGGDMVFCGTPPDIKDIFDILGLSKILKFAPTRDDAAKLLAR